MPNNSENYIIWVFWFLYLFWHFQKLPLPNEHREIERSLISSLKWIFDLARSQPGIPGSTLVMYHFRQNKNRNKADRPTLIIYVHETGTIKSIWCRLRGVTTYCAGSWTCKDSKFFWDSFPTPIATLLPATSPQAHPIWRSCRCDLFILKKCRFQIPVWIHRSSFFFSL